MKHQNFNKKNLIVCGAGAKLNIKFTGEQFWAYTFFYRDINRSLRLKNNEFNQDFEIKNFTCLEHVLNDYIQFKANIKNFLAGSICALISRQ